MLKRGVSLAILVVLLDQLSKWFMVDMIKRIGHPIEVTKFFSVFTVWNKGVSFGMFNHLEYAPLIFSGLAMAVVVLLLVWLYRAETLLTASGLGFVIGGAIGNTIDRVRFGAVIDFLDFQIAGYHWPAFNVADSAIFLGVVALLWDSVFQQNTQKQVGEGVGNEKKS